MKKFLLLAVSVLLTSSVNAQTISKKIVGKPQSPVKTSVTKVQNGTSVKMETSAKVKASQRPVMLKSGEELKLFGKTLKSFENKRLQVSSSRRAAELASSYNASGTNYSSKETETWTTTPVTLKDEAENEYPGLTNLLPTPFSNTDIDVVYSIDGGEISVPGQYVGTATFSDGNTYEVFIANYTNGSDDKGTISLTLGEDGSLTCNTAYVAYLLFEEGTTEYVKGAQKYYWRVYFNIKYVAEGKEVAPTAFYAPESLILYSCIDENGHGFASQHAMLPADATVSFTNFTADLADEWAWNASTIKYDATSEGLVKDQTVATSAEKDFAFTTEAGSLYAPVELVASYKGLASTPYIAAEEGALWYAGATVWAFNDGAEPVVTKANKKSGLAYYNGMSTSDGIHSWILYQGRPETPLYIEGVNLLMIDFQQNEGFNFKCKIQKITRDSDGDITLGDVIAESEVETEGIETTSWGAARLVWNKFQVVDDFGFKVPLDYMFIEDEFAIVFEGFDNGTFSGTPLAVKGDEYGMTSTYLIDSEQENKDEWADFAFWGFYGNIVAGFEGAAMGYLSTKDETNLTIPTTGGEAQIHVSPMLYTQSESGEYTTRLFLDADSEEVPEWLKFSSSQPVANGDDIDIDFDLVFQADALPEGVTGRQANLVFMQEGARLAVTVTQGDASGISVAKIDNNAKASTYNLVGQRVTNDYKGLVVKGGKKFVIK